MEWNKDKKVDFRYIFTIPNILSYFRIILIVPFVILFLREKYIASAVCLFASGLSDCVDGFLARKLNQVTELGKMLDPVADKLTLIAVGICVMIAEPMVLPVVVILMLKDLLMFIGASVLLRKKVKPCAAEWYGKVGTICFYVSIVSIVVFDIVLKVENFSTVSLVMLSVTACVMIYSLIRYYQFFRELMKNAKEESENKSE